MPYLEPGTPIYTEDLEAFEEMAGLRVRAGAAVFIRTGRWARRAEPFKRRPGDADSSGARSRLHGG